MFKEILSKIINAGIELTVDQTIESIKTKIHQQSTILVTRIKQTILVESCVITLLSLIYFICNHYAPNTSYAEFTLAVLKLLVLFTMLYRVHNVVLWYINHQETVKSYVQLWWLSAEKNSDIKPRFKRFVFLIIDQSYEKKVGNWKYVHMALSFCNITPEKEVHYEKIYTEIKQTSIQILKLNAFTLAYLLLIYILIRSVAFA